jgi:hypothetical protein
MSQEHRPLKSRSKGCARKSGLLNRTPYANHESPHFTQAFLDGIAATSALIFAVAGVTLLFMPGPCRWVAATSTLIFVVAGAQCFVAAGLSPGRPLKTPPRSAQTRPRWLGRPLTVRVPITVAFAWCGTTKTVGNNAPGNCRMPITVAICVQRYHGGLTPPAPGFVCGRRCRCGLAADESVGFFPRLADASRSWLHVRLLLQNCVARERVASRTTGGLRPPLLWCDANVCRREKRCLRCTNARAQERRASARRGRLAPRGLVRDAKLSAGE